MDVARNRIVHLYSHVALMEILVKECFLGRICNLTLKDSWQKNTLRSKGRKFHAYFFSTCVIICRSNNRPKSDIQLYIKYTSIYFVVARDTERRTNVFVLLGECLYTSNIFKYGICISYKPFYSTLVNFCTIPKCL